MPRPPRPPGNSPATSGAPGRGAALIEAKRYAEAEKVYRDDLQQHPHNGWSLLGLQQALAGKVQELGEVIRFGTGIPAGLLEIAVRDGSAAITLGLDVGMPVECMPATVG